MSFKQFDDYEKQIKAIGHRFGEQDIFHRLKRELDSQSAFCVTTNDFCFVLRPVIHQSGKQGLFIALGIHNNQACSVRDYYQIEKMAKHCGSAFIRFRSHRKGFKRLAVKHGFHVESTAGPATYYIKEV